MESVLTLYQFLKFIASIVPTIEVSVDPSSSKLLLLIGRQVDSTTATGF